MQWSLRLYLTKHLLQSSFRNIIYLKFPSPFLLLFPQMPDIALPSGAHRNRASFSPCYTLRGIFLKIRIHTLIWQFQYHHLNHQALHIYRYFLYNAKRLKSFDLSLRAEEGTWTLMILLSHGPEPCASANSATSASRQMTYLIDKTYYSIRRGICQEFFKYC